MPFVKVFIKTIFMSAPVLSQSVDLKIPSSVITSLMGLMSLIQSDKTSQNNLSELIILLITPPAPFTNSLIDVYNYTTEVLLVPDPNKSLAI